MAYAPAAIWAAANKILANVPGAVMSGIVGDVNHSYGYHLARSECRYGDYSTTLPRDRGGSASAASALDIKLPPDQMIAVTARLNTAAKAGAAGLGALREFAGTLDGRQTYAYDLSSGRPAFGTWDDSHLWHIHLSGYRDAADDTAAWLAIADVFIGGNTSAAAQGATPIDSGADIGGGLQGDDDMNDDQDARLRRVEKAAGDSWDKLIQIQESVDNEVRRGLDFAQRQIATVAGMVSGLAAAVAALQGGGSVDMAALEAAAEKGAKDALANLTLVSK